MAGAPDNAPWALGASSSSSSSCSRSSSANGADTWRPSVAAKPKAKGRPRKYPSDVNSWKERREFRAKQADVGSAAGDAPLVLADPLAGVLRPLGGPTCELVARAVAQNIVLSSDVGQRVSKLVHAYLESPIVTIRPGKKRPDHSITSWSLPIAAVHLDLDRRTLSRKVLSMAQAV